MYKFTTTRDGSEQRLQRARENGLILRNVLNYNTERIARHIAVIDLRRVIHHLTSDLGDFELILSTCAPTNTTRSGFL